MVMRVSSFQDVPIHHVDRLAARIGEHLVEDGAEHLLEPVPLDVAQAWSAYHVVHGQERMRIHSALASGLRPCSSSGPRLGAKISVLVMRSLFTSLKRMKSRPV